MKRVYKFTRAPSANESPHQPFKFIRSRICLSNVIEMTPQKTDSHRNEVGAGCRYSNAICLFPFKATALWGLKSLFFEEISKQAFYELKEILLQEYYIHSTGKKMFFLLAKVCIFLSSTGQGNGSFHLDLFFISLYSLLIESVKDESETIVHRKSFKPFV